MFLKTPVISQSFLSKFSTLPKGFSLPKYLLAIASEITTDCG